MATVVSVQQVHDWARQQYQVGDDPEGVHPVLDKQQGETQGPDSKYDPPESVHRAAPSRRRPQDGVKELR